MSKPSSAPSLGPPFKPSFGSDNHARMHPKILEALQNANSGVCPTYGDDPWTKRAKERVAQEFAVTADQVHFVFNGTGGNVVGLSAILKPNEAILCAESAHIQTDECGAAEAHIGAKLITVPTLDGKLTPELISNHNSQFGQSGINARVISISQATELGTVYSPQEILALSDFAQSHSLYLHVDGARLSNAAVSLGLSLSEITTHVGVDVVTFGGTKNGLMLGEAVIFCNSNLGHDFSFIQKQGMQLPSKMRFISAQFEALMKDELWKTNAAHANAMARHLEQSLGTYAPREFLVQVNAVFAWLPQTVIQELQKRWLFYIWEGRGHFTPPLPQHQLVRLMTSFETTPLEVEQFAQDVIHTIKEKSGTVI